MPESHLGPVVSGDEIKSELRRRRKKDIFKTVSGSSRELIARKVELEEAEGWQVVRRNIKSTRMKRAKPAAEQHEDEVWTILAQMGFKEMSQGRQFEVATKTRPRQIDVFAKDDETAVIVECTRRDIPSKKRMDVLINKIRAYRESLIMSVHKAYSQQGKHKLKFVIATRNISWSEADLDKCKEAKIAVLADSELNYYAQLSRHLKSAARYQFLAHMFGGQKIDGLAKTVMATRGKLGDHTFFTFLIRPDDLLKIAYVGHKASRNTEDLNTYQRMLQPNRLKKIASYINEGGRFPTNIVVNLKTPKKEAKLQFDQKEGGPDGTLGTLHLPALYSSAWIIDGQHRLYGYAYAREQGGFNKDSTLLPVLAFENLPSDEEMNLFIDINSKQVKVPKNLLVELYADLKWQSEDPSEAFQALLSRVAASLNNENQSPLKDRVVVSGTRKTNKRCLTQTSIQAGLREARLLGNHVGGAILPGPLSTAKVDDYSANLKKAVSVLSFCMGLFSKNLSEHWKLGDYKDENQCGYLCTNIGIRALFLLIKDIADHIWKEKSAELFYCGAEETNAVIEPYLQILVNHFRSASAQEFLALRRIGSSLSAVRQQAHELGLIVSNHASHFNPPELQKYRESRDVEGTKKANEQILDIERRLIKYVIGTLEQHYGENWWTKGVPLKIRQRCSAAWEARNREGKVEQNLFLIEYMEICQERENWDLFRDVISLDASDKSNKKAMTKWMRELNDIRNFVFHPSRGGVLSNDQVAWINRVHCKVKDYFPRS
ncbi:DGQHR domain-containing protein [Candidatus Foliamicus sp.]